MKQNALKTLTARLARALLVAFAFMQLSESRAHATYQVGQVITNNFYFVARRPFTRPDGTAVPAGAHVYLHDFAGRIVFLEWFAVWCPYCVAAAPQVRTGIVDWYAARGGNPSGVPVLHIAVNQEASAVYQPSTDKFVAQQAFDPVVNDYEGSVIDPVRFMFQSSGQPIFAVINGVTNSPSHQPWQLLVNYLGYGQTDFNQTLAGFRSVIDTVQAPVPAPELIASLGTGADFEFTLLTQPNRSYRVQTSSDLTNWTTLRTVTGSTNAVVFRDSGASAGHRFYRAVTP
jgi:hypothetical protein